MRYFCLALFLFFVAGCASFDKYVSPENQCRAIRAGARISFSLGIKQVRSTKDDLVKLQSLIRKEIMPRLEGKDRKEMTKAEWDEVLSLLDKKVPDEYKPAIQAAMMYIIAFVPQARDQASLSLGERFIFYAKCMFKGLLDGILSLKRSSMSSSSKDLEFPSKSIKEGFKKGCKECSKKPSK